VFAYQDTREATDVAFTDRHGGASDGPYASLNLGESSGDDPAVVRKNIDIVARAFARGYQAPGDPLARPGGAPSPRVVRIRQVHGAHVHVVDEAVARSPHGQPPIVADALVTTVPGVVLMVRAADCAPVLLTDPTQRVVGAAHVGRAGMVAGVVANTVRAMRECGAVRVMAWVGPHVCGSCYEVSQSMRAEVAAAVPESYARTSWGAPAVDIGAGVRAQLTAHDVEVVEVAGCTVEDEDLFSYRRQGKASGRLAGLVWIRP
jgi:YfiH family protein